MLDDQSLTQDPRHQPMDAVLPVPIRIVSEPHRLHHDCPMLDAVMRMERKRCMDEELAVLLRRR